MATTRIEANLAAATADPARVIEYRPGGGILGILPWVLLLAALAMAMLIFGTGSDGAVLPAVLLLVLLPGVVLLDLWKHRPSARPGLVLSPEGLALQTDGWGTLRLPWAAIQAIDTRDYEGFALRLRGRQRIGFRDVTMIRLPPGLLEAERAAGRFAPTGPTVDWVVRPEPDGTWIALGHETYSLSPAEVRAPLEARWLAFRDRRAPPAASHLPPLRLGGFRPSNPPLFGAGMAAGVGAILVLLANLAGVWETRAQAEARAWAERFEAERAAERAAEAERQERWRAFDERMERAFPPRP